MSSFVDAKAAGPVGEPCFHVHPDPVAFAARRVVERMNAIHREQGCVRLAVAGGSTASVLGTARRMLASEVWHQVCLTWVDERCVPFSHGDSNRGSAYRDGHLSLEDSPRLELPLYLDDEQPLDACERVCAALRQDFRNSLDLLLLGMGADGHIASLFPGSPGDPQGRAVFAVTNSPKPPPCRITLALSTLMWASTSVMLAVGSEKREALRRLRMGDPDLPASALRDLEIVTDLGDAR